MSGDDDACDTMLCPWCSMWIGVMVMIATMINCVRIMMPAPLARAHDHRRDPDSLATAGAVDPDDPPAALSLRDDFSAAMLRASSSGSGRNRTQSTTPAAAYAAAASMNGPASGGTPSARGESAGQAHQVGTDDRADWPLRQARC